MIGSRSWQVNARPTVNPIDVACRRQLLRPLTVTVIVVAPSILYHCRLLVAFYDRHHPAMTVAHHEYPLVLHSALLPVSQRARQYFEDNLNKSSSM